MLSLPVALDSYCVLCDSTSLCKLPHMHLGEGFVPKRGSKKEVRAEKAICDTASVCVA